MFKKDTRDKFWSKIEQEIYLRSKNKDKNFSLTGKWKKFVRKQNSFKIYAVDGKWIRNNLDVTFSDGGHGYVHSFIPLDEVWVSTYHFSKKEGAPGIGQCKSNRPSKKVSKKYFEGAIIHEIAEFREMKKGKNYWQAHQIALKKEKEFLKNY